MATIVLDGRFYSPLVEQNGGGNMYFDFVVVKIYFEVLFSLEGSKFYGNIHTLSSNQWENLLKMERKE